MPNSPSGRVYAPIPKATKPGRGLKMAVGTVVAAIAGWMLFSVYNRTTAEAAVSADSQKYGPATATAADIAPRRNAVTATSPVVAATPPPAPPQPAPTVAVAQVPAPTQPPPPAAPTPEAQAAAAYAAAQQKAMDAPMTPAGWKTPVSSAGVPMVAQDAMVDQNNQAGKEAFLKRQPASVSAAAVRMRPGKYTVLEGWLIPAILQTMMSSDLPGEIKAMVRENVYDTATGQNLLVPQGSFLLGIYSSNISMGQRAAQQIWHRIEFPDGSSINLGAMQGHDAQGRAGLRDKVDNHYKRLIGTALLTSAFFAASSLATNRRGSVLGYPSAQETAATAAATQMSQEMSQIFRQQSSIQPTIEIRPGDKFDIFVNHDLEFEGAYRPMQPR